MITSLSNPRIKRACRLRRRRERSRQGRILIDGARETQRAIEAGVHVTEIFICPALCQDGPAADWLPAARQQGLPLVEVSEPVYRKLAYGQRSDGVVAVARTPHRRLGDWPQEPPALIAVLDTIEKPGNLGAIARSADAAGVTALVAVGSGTDLFNPNAIRSSLGTIFTVPVCAAEPDELIDWLGRHGLTIVAADVAGPLRYDQYDWRQPTALVLGSEARGLSPCWSGRDLVRVHIPMCGVADSLNVSTAAAVLFYEAWRQRIGSPPAAPHYP